MKTRYEQLRKWYFKNQWVLYVEALVVVALSALQVFVVLPRPLKIILAVIVFLAYVLLGASLLIRETGLRHKDREFYKIAAKEKSSKTVEDIMTIAYAGVVTIGTFVNSVLIIVIGIILFVSHTVLSYAMYRYYERKYAAANARRVENQQQ